MVEYGQRLSIKSWADDDKPREKLVNKGRKTLSDAELIAILLGSGSKKESAVELSKRILSTYDNSLIELGKQRVNDLLKFTGVGPAKAVTVVAALEIGRRRREQETVAKPKIGSSKDVYELFYSKLADLPHEEFWVLLLNRAHKMIDRVNISRGGTHGTVADTKIIFKQAIESLAPSIILCHNHPSGNLKPSHADIKLTQKLKEAGKLLDIQVLDHIIIAESGYYSFADEGDI